MLRQMNVLKQIWDIVFGGSLKQLRPTMPIHKSEACVGNVVIIYLQADFDKNGYLPIIVRSGWRCPVFAIMCSSCYSSGDDSKLPLWDRAIQKVHQVFDTISNEACKASNVMFTLLLVGVLVETQRNMNCSAIALNRQRVFVYFFWWSRTYNVSLTIHTTNEEKKFNEGIRHAECFFLMDAGVNPFIVKLGGTVKVGIRISSKTMHQNGLMETTEAHLLLNLLILLLDFLITFMMLT
ncbi:hypothetical protein H5410_053881 [Solanum commersonii]|uniref:Uncharacterized protein n=1 Tax=Solanum commersonii TaxID=4109 RepID=A0A9J5X7M1_SOLCO|nr:hypothetical protein H5410_053881 [Solanum commersonii]